MMWHQILRAHDFAMFMLFGIVALFAFNWHTFTDARPRRVLELVTLLGSVAILAVEILK